MEEKKIQKNIKLYYWFQAFKEPLFWGPILITFIQAVSSMSLSEIFIMESVVVALLIFLEVPTGALADLLGRKKTILLGAIFLMIDNFLFASASSPFMIWFANIVWTFGYSLISGADSAFLYDSLRVINKEGEYRRIRGQANALRLFLMAVCAISVGYLALVHIRLPIYLGSIFLLANVFITMFFHEPPVSDKQSIGFKNHWNLMKISVIFVANHKKIKWIIGYTVLLGVISKIWFFTYNPYFEIVELPIIYFGWLFFVLNMVAALSSYWAGWISKKISDLNSIIIMILLLAVPIFLMGTFVTKLAVLLILSQNFIRGYLDPFMTHFLHSYIESKNRATVISIKSAVVGFGQLTMLSVFGILLKFQSLTSSLQILGVFATLIGLFFIFSYLKIFKKE